MMARRDMKRMVPGGMAVPPSCMPLRAIRVVMVAGGYRRSDSLNTASV
jgi:hypothetical protein